MLVFVVFRTLPQGTPTTLTEILAQLPGEHTRGAVRCALGRLVSAKLVRLTRRKGPHGPPRALFHRPEGVAPTEHEIAAALRQALPESRRRESASVPGPRVIMRTTPWRRDRQGNLVRTVTGVEADSPPAVAREQLKPATSRTGRNPVAAEVWSETTG